MGTLQSVRVILVWPAILIFWHSSIRVLWRSGLSSGVPECQKIKNGGLDQYGAERFGIDSFLSQSEKVWYWKG